MLKFHALAFILFSNLATLAVAAEVTSQARAYHQSCGYYSATTGDALIKYRNKDLPWGVKIELVYGMDGFKMQGGGGETRQDRFDWRRKQTKTLPAVADYTWQTTLTVQTHSRSSNEFVEALDFVFRITYPDGSVDYDDGVTEDGTLGFYKVSFPRGYIRCVTGDNDRPDFEAAEIQVVRRP